MLYTGAVLPLPSYSAPARVQRAAILNLKESQLHTHCFKLALPRERERNVLFNDALNTFYLRLYIWLRTILIVRKETCCRHIGYSYRLTARVLLYASSHRQDNTYHGLCYTSHGTLAGIRNSSMGPPHEGSIRWPTAPWANALPLSYVPFLALPRVQNSLEQALAM